MSCCVLCEKNWNLGLRNFDNVQCPVIDPLETLFKDELYSFQNPRTKHSERKPIFNVISSQTGAENLSENCFKMFPPVILPPTDIPHGFPNSFPENLMDFDNKQTLPLEAGTILDKDLYKKTWFPKFLEHWAESAVSVAFESVFSGRRGFMIQNYHPETYLQPLIDKAKKQRKQFGRKSSRLSPLQEKLCQAISSPAQNIEDFNKELEDRNRETDNVIVLEKEKLFIVVETKSRTKNLEKCINTLKPACEKQKKRRQYFMGNHQNIMTKEWRFVNLVALPFIEDKSSTFGNQVCSQCLDFILDKEDIINLGDWMERVLQIEPIITRKVENDELDKSYTNLYNRLIGFMSLSLKFGLSSNVFMDASEARAFVEENILGKERSKGVTCEEATDEPIVMDISGKTLREKPLSDLQVLYFWNEEQLQFLLQNKHLVLFLADFGVGKTLMMKHQALKVASENPDEEVIFLSLASAKRHDDYQSNGDKLKVYRNPSIFDVASKMDFEGTKVRFVSLSDLLSENDFNDISVDGESTFSCNVVRHFMEEHKDAHFFIDEFPVQSKMSDDVESFLVHIKQNKSRRCLWLTLRLCEVRSQDHENIVKNIDFYKTFFKNCGFHIPVLNTNMRNSSNIVSTYDSIYGFRKKDEKNERIKDAKIKDQVKMVVERASLPQNTVQGMKSVIVPVEGSSRRFHKEPIGALGHVIKTYFKNENEPIVVLITEHKYFGTSNEKYANIISKASEDCNRDFLIYPFRNKERVSETRMEELREYLQNPQGVLVTDAEAFNGMQARNVVVISDGKKLDRNFIMRANSFVVFIQKREHIYPFINVDQSIDLDRRFLPENVQRNDWSITKQTYQLWLWQIPFGTTEEDIRNHMKKKGVDVSQIHIEPMSHKEEFVGFVIELKEDIPGTHFKDLNFVRPDKDFWPPGWSKKRFRNKNVLDNEAKNRCFKFSIEPTWFCLTVRRGALLTKQEVEQHLTVSISLTYHCPCIHCLDLNIQKHFLFKDRGIAVNDIIWSEVPYGKNIYRKYFLQVSKENYARVIAPEFWQLLASVGSVNWVKEHDIKEVLSRRERGETSYPKSDPKPV